MLLLLWPNSFIIGAPPPPLSTTTTTSLFFLRGGLTTTTTFMTKFLHKSSRGEKDFPTTTFYVKKSFIKVAPESLSPHDYFLWRNSFIAPPPPSPPLLLTTSFFFFKGGVDDYYYFYDQIPS